MAYQKDLQLQLDIIAQANSWSSVSVSITDHGQAKALITKKGHKFELEIEAILSEFTPIEELEFVFDGQQYVIELPDHVSDSIDAGLKGVRGTSRFEVRMLRSKGFDPIKKAQFRCFYPTDPNKLQSFRFVLESSRFDDARHDLRCVRFSMGTTRIDVFQLEYQGHGFYIFDSTDEQTFADFRSSCFAIQQALGFGLGFMPGGEEFTFDDLQFQYCSRIRPALKMPYNPVTANPYSRWLDYQNEVEKYEKLLEPIPMQVMSTLACQIRNDGAYSAAILLFIEAAHARSLLVMPSVFAVIIEALSKQLSVKKNRKRSSDSRP